MPNYKGQKLPSHSRPKKLMAVPPGTISVFRVSTVVTGSKARSWAMHGIYKDADEAYTEADTIQRDSKWLGTVVKVEHKAAIELDGKLYMIYLNPIKLNDDIKATPRSDASSVGKVNAESQFKPTAYDDSEGPEGGVLAENCRTRE
jgi:hypothetical protein